MAIIFFVLRLEINAHIVIFVIFIGLSSQLCIAGSTMMPVIALSLTRCASCRFLGTVFDWLRTNQEGIE
jgi:hypothetical protein